jgi:hypothetical protein
MASRFQAECLDEAIEYALRVAHESDPDRVTRLLIARAELQRLRETEVNYQAARAENDAMTELLEQVRR